VAKKLKHHSLIDKVYKRLNLYIAFERVRLNKGAGGIDKVSLGEFERNLEFNLEEIHRLLYEDKYQPRPVRRVFIPKPNGDKRPLGIPTVRDRIVQQAILNRIGEIFEAKFLDCSYGYRPSRDALGAIRKIEQYLEQGYQWVVEADIVSFFDIVNQQKLMDLVAEEIADGRVLRLIEAFLRAGIMQEGKVENLKTGMPQGGVISPLLANIYLHPFDERMTQKGYQIVRYADDILILCRSKREAESALKETKIILEGELKLKVNMEKTKIFHKSQTFEFLGYLFGSGYSDYKMPRPRAIESFKARVRWKTRRQQPKAMSQIIEELNPIIRGWGRYFMYGNSKRIFWQLDCWIRDRVRAYKLKKWSKLSYQKIPGYRLEKMGLVSLYGLFSQQRPKITPC
jgi:group II intron reverse transcriptase/maturase